MKRTTVLCAGILLAASLGSEALAWRGAAVYHGPNGGAAAVGPRGGVAVRGPGGAAAYRGPYGGAAVRGPNGAWAARTPTVYGGAYYRPGAVAAGVAVGAAVG